MSITMPGTTNQGEFIPEALEKILNVCKKIDYESTQIVLGHPSDLFKLDMSKFSSYCYFISRHEVEPGTFLLVKDGDLKELLYEFVKNNPDRVFRGRRTDNEL